MMNGISARGCITVQRIIRCSWLIQVVVRNKKWENRENDMIESLNSFFSLLLFVCCLLLPFFFQTHSFFPLALFFFLSKNFECFSDARYYFNQNIRIEFKLRDDQWHTLAEILYNFRNDEHYGRKDPVPGPSILYLRQRLNGNIDKNRKMRETFLEKKLSEFSFPHWLCSNTIDPKQFEMCLRTGMSKMIFWMPARDQNGVKDNSSMKRGNLNCGINNTCPSPWDNVRAKAAVVVMCCWRYCCFQE